MENFGCANEIPLDDLRQKDWDRQRRYRGFDNTELWTLFYTLSRFILPRLKAFKEETVSRPYGLTAEEWNGILDTMIEGFEETLKEPFEEDHEKIQKGLDVFAKWYMDLWS